MKILVSNDDGIHARGIQELAETLAKEHDVWVVAPSREQSATAHALTLHKPIRVEEISLNFPVKAAYSVLGTPSDCVKIGLNALLTDVDFDMVISGINHGPNLGSDVLYSGTVSAALEGAINGLPSIAMSLMNGYEKMAEFDHGAEFILRALPAMMEAGIPEKTVINVNIPAVPLHDMVGVHVGELAKRMFTDTYERRVDPRGGVYYWLAGEKVDKAQNDNSDLAAILNNKVSITPVHYDLTNQKALSDIKDSYEAIDFH